MDLQKLEMKVKERRDKVSSRGGVKAVCIWAVKCRVMNALKTGGNMEKAELGQG